MKERVKSSAYANFEHAIQDAQDLYDHYKELNAESRPPPVAEVIKRGSLVMALAALETYVEDRAREAATWVAGTDPHGGRLPDFFRASLESDLKRFHSPSPDRIKELFLKYFQIDVTEGWSWPQMTPDDARSQLRRINEKRGLIAHQTRRPRIGDAEAHVVTIDALRRHLHFLRELVQATDAYLAEQLKPGPRS